MYLSWIHTLSDILPQVQTMSRQLSTEMPMENREKFTDSKMDSCFHRGKGIYSVLLLLLAILSHMDYCILKKKNSDQLLNSNIKRTVKF